MSLHQLRKDADLLLGGRVPVMYEWRNIEWTVHLTEEGRFHSILPMATEGRKRAGRMMLVPAKPSASCSNEKCGLLVETAEWTFGLACEGVKENREHIRHENYLLQLERCAVDTHVTEVRLVLEFLRSWKEQGVQLPEEMAGSAVVAFCVANRSVTDHSAIHQFWKKVNEEDCLLNGDEEAAKPVKRAKQVQGQCSFCGQRNVGLVRKFPLRARCGFAMPLILSSANEEAYERYDRPRTTGSCVCFECAERTTQALQYLANEPRHHLRSGGHLHVWWSSNPDYRRENFDDWDPKEIQKLVASAEAGELSARHDESPFHLLSLSATETRPVWRGSRTTTVAQWERSLGQWFLVQRLGTPEGGEPVIQRLHDLAVAGAQSERKGALDYAKEALTQRALYGRPLPRVWITEILRQQTAAITTASVGPHTAWAGKAAEHYYRRAILLQIASCDMKADARPSCPAFVAGRLLAKLDNIQDTYHRRPGGTRIDPKSTFGARFFLSASTRPGAILPNPIGTSQRLLKTIAIEWPGASARLSAELAELMGGLDGLPPLLGLPDRLRFEQGFYFQQAQDASEARARIEEKRNNSDE